MQSKMEKTLYPGQTNSERIIPISTKRNPGKNAQIDAESRISNHHLSKTPPFGLRFSCTFWLNIHKYNFFFAGKNRNYFFLLYGLRCEILRQFEHFSLDFFLMKSG